MWELEAVLIVVVLVGCSRGGGSGGRDIWHGNGRHRLLVIERFGSFLEKYSNRLLYQ